MPLLWHPCAAGGCWVPHRLSPAPCSRHEEDLRRKTSFKQFKMNMAGGPGLSPRGGEPRAAARPGRACGVSLGGPAGALRARRSRAARGASAASGGPGGAGGAGPAPPACPRRSPGSAACRDSAALRPSDPRRVPLAPQRARCPAGQPAPPSVRLSQGRWGAAPRAVPHLAFPCRGEYGSGKPGGEPAEPGSPEPLPCQGCLASRAGCTPVGRAGQASGRDRGQPAGKVGKAWGRAGAGGWQRGGGRGGGAGRSRTGRSRRRSAGGASGASGVEEREDPGGEHRSGYRWPARESSGGIRGRRGQRRRPAADRLIRRRRRMHGAPAARTAPPPPPPPQGGCGQRRERQQR